MDQQFMDKKFNSQKTSDCTLCCPQCFTIIAYDAKHVEPRQKETKDQWLESLQNDLNHFKCNEVCNVKIDELQELSPALQVPNNEFQWHVCTRKNKKKEREGNSSSLCGYTPPHALYHAIRCDECETVLGIREQWIEIENEKEKESENSKINSDANLPLRVKEDKCQLSTSTALWKVVEIGMEHFEYHNHSYDHKKEECTQTAINDDDDIDINSLTNLPNVQNDDRNSNACLDEKKCLPSDQLHQDPCTTNRCDTQVIYHFNQVLPGML